MLICVLRKVNCFYILTINEEVRNFALANQITPYTVFLGAYEYAVAKFTNQSETTVCTVTHGRFDKQLKNTVGMMVRTLRSEERRVGKECRL